jgi:hypothetical protein
MNEPARQQRNQQKLAELYPTFRVRIAAVIAELEGKGIRPRIQDAWRSPEDQLAAFNSGHSKLKYGFHNVTGVGGVREALAVDLLDDDSPLTPSQSYLLRVAAAAQARGLTTGIRWGLPKALAAAIDAAIAAGMWQAPVKVGWDPTHIEPVGLRATEAKAGKRPA